MKSVLEVKNLKKNFENFTAVNNINFSLNERNTIGLLGPNGCGKTTTIAMLLGLITPTSGSIKIDNQNLNPKDHQFLSKMNFASPYVELPKKLTVMQNLKVYAMMYEIKNPTKKIEELIENLKLQDFIYKKTGELSSGQRNRISLAKSLINDPQILLLDEPTASLDPDTGDFIRSFIEEYQKNNPISILLASHNMNEVNRLCDHILMMKEGKIIDQGNAEYLISKHGRNNLEEVFLKIAREKNEIRCPQDFAMNDDRSHGQPNRTLFERLMANGDPFVDQLDRNAKTLLKGALTRLDVVSREEFDAQTAVLRRTRERLEQLERDLASLSQSLDLPDGPDGT